MDEGRTWGAHKCQKRATLEAKSDLLWGKGWDADQCLPRQYVARSSLSESTCICIHTHTNTHTTHTHNTHTQHTHNTHTTHTQHTHTHTHTHTHMRTSKWRGSRSRRCLSHPCIATSMFANTCRSFADASCFFFLPTISTNYIVLLLVFLSLLQVLLWCAHTPAADSPTPPVCVCVCMWMCGCGCGCGWVYVGVYISTYVYTHVHTHKYTHDKCHIHV